MQRRGHTGRAHYKPARRTYVRPPNTNPNGPRFARTSLRADLASLGGVIKPMYVRTHVRTDVRSYKRTNERTMERTDGRKYVRTYVRATARSRPSVSPKAEAKGGVWRRREPPPAFPTRSNVRSCPPGGRRKYFGRFSSCPPCGREKYFGSFF